MNETVLDASVVLKWFGKEGERHAEAARMVRTRFESGDLLVFAPTLLFVEILNVAGRRWRWAAKQLEQLASALSAFGFELSEPELSTVARWTAEGLTAYDACYVAIAETSGAPLITDDEEILRLAPRLTTSLSTIA